MLLPPAAAAGRGAVGSCIAKHVLPWASVTVTPLFQHALLQREKAERGPLSPSCA